MIFNVNVTGEFNNVKGLRIVQQYCIKVKCGACNEEYPNEIKINSNEVRSIKIKEKPKMKEYFNLIVNCKKCENVMCIEIFEPENRFEFQEDLWLCPVLSDKCHVSTIKSDSAVVTSVDQLILDAVSEDKGFVFSNCDFNKRTLAQDDFSGSTLSILNFLIQVEQIH